MIACSLRPGAEQCVGDLDQAAGAVADQRVGADRAAMIEVGEDLQAVAHDLVRLLALDVRDEADAARVMLVRGSYRPCFSGALDTSDPRSSFIGPDRRLVRERQRDLVESGEQAFAPKWVHTKVK